MSANILHWNKADRIKIDKNPNNDKGTTHNKSLKILRKQYLKLFHNQEYHLCTTEMLMIMVIKKLQ